MFVGSARAADPAPTASLPTLATGTYVELAYDSLDAKKQDKLTNNANAGDNIAIDDSGKINLDLAGVDVAGVGGVSSDGVYVLTATITNGVATLKWENITRTTAN